VCNLERISLVNEDEGQDPLGDYRAKKKKMWGPLREERRRGGVENRGLRRIFGPKMDEVTGEWRKLINEELNDLYSSPTTVRVIKRRDMRWARHVAHMKESCVQGFGGET
jgi:hypothetical protein